MEPADFHGHRLRFAANPVARALACSLAFHVLVFGGLELAQRWHLHLPEWLKTVLDLSPRFTEQKEKAPAAEREAPTLTFVEVDPSQPASEPPKDTRNYSIVNSLAANPDVSIDANKPKLDGTQDKVPKVMDTLRPAPPQLLTPLKPEPTPFNPEAGTKPGDLAFAKPADAKPKEEEKPKRPRTLIEAQLQKGIIPGPKMKQEGGVRRHGTVAALDAKATPFGAYDAAMIDAIAKRWYAILDATMMPTRPGKVVLEFRQYSDGRVTDLKVIESNVGDALAFYCQKAVSDPSPYEKWPADMRRMNAKDYREIRFVFWYEY